MCCGQSLSEAAHEIKNQLAIILQAVAYLRDTSQQADDRIKTTLGYMEEAAGKIDKVIDSMLDSSQPKS